MPGGRGVPGGGIHPGKGNPGPGGKLRESIGVQLEVFKLKTLVK
jgi:hypothetical protein